MQFYRLIKPKWAYEKLANGEPNPKFIQAIPGRNVIEGCNFTPEFLQQKNSEGYNIYFFPNHPSRDVYKEGIKALSGRTIDVFNFVFVDMDLKDGIYKSKEEFVKRLEQFPLKPTMVVDSGNGVHAYWRVRDLKREQYVITQLALLRHFNTDESVWSVLQLMRLPGYNNTKKFGEPIPAQILPLSSNQIYEISQFPKEIYDLDQSIILKAQNHIARLEGRVETNLSGDINLEELPDKFLELLGKDSKITELYRNPKADGDRSAADMKLANILYSKGFNKKEALSVLANTEKALEKGAHRIEYAYVTVDKVYSDRPVHKFKTVSQILRDEGDRIMPPKVNGPYYLDSAVLGEPWRKRELLGIIAGAGVGKTAKALNIIRDIIKNNPDRDEVYVFFSLEMPVKQIIKRWIKLVGDDTTLADKLYVIGNTDDEGMPRNIGLQEVYEYCTEIKQTTGMPVGALVIDHIHILSTHINVQKNPNFGIEANGDTGYGVIQNLTRNELCTQLKPLVMALDTYGIILTQTTKEKGIGDTPIDKDGAYGISQYEWIIDRIISIWQPLMRVQNQTPYRFLAYQYVKIREKHPDDKIMCYDKNILTYDLASGNLRVATQDEYRAFSEMLPLANEARENDIKKKDTGYAIQIDLNEVDAALNKLKAVT